MQRTQATSLFQVSFRDWPRWWNSLSGFSKWGAAALVPAYWAVIATVGELKSDHWMTGLVILALSYVGPKAREALRLILPVLLTAMVYDSQRYYGAALRGRIRVSEPYDFDKYFFGITTTQGVLTPNEWFEQNTSVILDLITGFFYLTFIAIFVSMAIYYRFWLSRKGTAKQKPEQVKKLSIRMMWSFFWVNVLGYSTYYWYAAAPPWYAAKYGFGPINFNAPPDPAGTARFDALLGTTVFANMYSKSANIFGAIPSLHCAYPFLAVVFAYKIGALRGWALFYCFWVSFGAVYLNHHYILDVVWGWAYSGIVAAIVLWYGQKKDGLYLKTKTR